MLKYGFCLISTAGPAWWNDINALCNGSGSPLNWLADHSREWIPTMLDGKLCVPLGSIFCCFDFPFYLLNKGHDFWWRGALNNLSSKQLPLNLRQGHLCG
jgi:hypothetical protein